MNELFVSGSSRVSVFEFHRLEVGISAALNNINVKNIIIKIKKARR